MKTNKREKCPFCNAKILSSLLAKHIRYVCPDSARKSKAEPAPVFYGKAPSARFVQGGLFRPR